MNDLDKALADITTIRSQMARGTEFRGYGPVTVGLTAVMAIAAGAAQALWLPDPTANILVYIGLWVSVALVSVVLVAAETVARSRRIHSGLADAMIQEAAEQFIPAGVAGALTTFVLYRFAPESLWVLPGLWQIIFSLGFFAACRSLPRPMFAVPVWYLAAGLGCLAFAQGSNVFSPWAMALPFAIGQLMMAAILYVTSGARDVQG
jgi:hypothetical protein